MIGIYKITNPVGAIYIGQSKNIELRFKKYKILSGGVKNQPKLYQSLLQYGVSAHVYDVVKECKESELDDLEKFYINYFNSFKNGLNMTDGGIRKFNISKEVSSKISEANRNRSDEVKKKIGQSKIGNKNMLGKHHTEDTKIKISKAKSGIKLTEQHKIKISKANTGRSHSEEAKVKMRKKRDKSFGEKIKLSWLKRRQNNENNSL